MAYREYDDELLDLSNVSDEDKRMYLAVKPDVDAVRAVYTRIGHAEYIIEMLEALKAGAVEKLTESARLFAHTPVVYSGRVPAREGQEASFATVVVFVPVDVTDAEREEAIRECLAGTGLESLQTPKSATVSVLHAVPGPDTEQ